MVIEGVRKVYWYAGTQLNIFFIAIKLNVWDIIDVGADIDFIVFFKDITDSWHEVFEFLNRHLYRVFNTQINTSNA